MIRLVAGRSGRCDPYTVHLWPSGVAMTPRNKKARAGKDSISYPLLAYFCILLLASCLFATYILVTYDRLEIDKTPGKTGHYGMERR